MSYILDALKRSEQERKHQSRPGSLDLDAGLLHLRKRKTPVWVYLLAVVLLLNLGLMLVLYRDKLFASSTPPLNATTHAIQRMPVLDELIDEPARAKSESSSSPAPNAKGPQRTLEAPAVSAAVQYSESESYTYILPEDQSDPELTNELVRESGIVSDETEAWDIVAPASTSAPTKARPAEDTTVAETPAKAVPSRIPTLADSTPLLHELDAGFSRSVPAIGFNSHIYSEVPGARRVMINNIYLREGEGFSGINVVEIGEQYVVFDKQGHRFKLPVMKDWNP